MTGDPWGLDELPAVPDADLQPLPPVLAEIAAAMEDGTRLPFRDPSGTGRPGAADLPEVQALAAQGWKPLPGGLGSDVGLVPAVWPPEHRCWVHDRVPPFGVCSYGPGETYIEPDMRNPQREHWELARAARSVDLLPPPPGRLWLLRSPWPRLRMGSLLLAIRQARDTGGFGWDAVGMMRAAQTVLAQGEEATWDSWSGRQADAARAWRTAGPTPSDVDDWISLGLGPDELDVLTRSPDEGGAGLRPADVREWCAAVSLGAEPTDRDVAKVLAWRGIGIAADAPVTQLAAVMVEREPAEVATWLEAGLTLADVAAWDADDLTRALRWRDAGFEAREARALTVADPTLSPEEAAAFDRLGIDTGARRRWVEAGFSAAEARTWTDLDVVAGEARVWRSLGRGPELAREHRRAGGGSLPADFEGGWIGFGTGRDELHFGVTDPPGTRGSAAETGWDGIPDHLHDDVPDDGTIG